MCMEGLFAVGGAIVGASLVILLFALLESSSK